MNIIGLVGRAGSGKDTVADYLADIYGYKVVSPAAPMVAGLRAMLGLPKKYFTDRALKETPIPGLGLSPRQLMQTLGTEWGRKYLGPDVWINIVLSTKGSIAIPGIRFPNEAAAVHAAGGKLWRIDRRTYDVAPHESESYIDTMAVDVAINNNGTIQDLHTAIRDTMGVNYHAHA